MFKACGREVDSCRAEDSLAVGGSAVPAIRRVRDKICIHKILF